MSQPLTAHDLLPLVARLAPQERKRLVRLIQATAERDAALYLASPPAQGEFGSDANGLGWDADGWDPSREARRIRWYTFRAPDKRRPVMILARPLRQDSCPPDRSARS